MLRLVSSNVFEICTGCLEVPSRKCCFDAKFTWAGYDSSLGARTGGSSSHWSGGSSAGAFSLREERHAWEGPLLGAASAAFALPAGTGPTTATGNAHHVAAEMWVKEVTYLPMLLAASYNNFVQEGLSKTVWLFLKQAEKLAEWENY